MFSDIAVKTFMERCDNYFNSITPCTINNNRARFIHQFQNRLRQIETRKGCGDYINRPIVYYINRPVVDYITRPVVDYINRPVVCYITRPVVDYSNRPVFF